jgi:hypothetical protein
MYYQIYKTKSTSMLTIGGFFTFDMAHFLRRCLSCSAAEIWAKILSHLDKVISRFIGTPPSAEVKGEFCGLEIACSCDEVLGYWNFLMRSREEMFKEVATL